MSSGAWSLWGKQNVGGHRGASGRKQSHLSILTHGNSSKLGCKRMVGWFLLLHQAGGDLGKQVSMAGGEMVPELLWAISSSATEMTWLSERSAWMEYQTREQPLLPDRRGWQSAWPALFQ